MWRGEVRRGRAGQAFDFGEPGVLDGATAKSLAAGRHGPRQVGQIVKTKPLRRSCLRILDQSLEPREPALQATGRLSSPVRSPGFLKGGLDKSPSQSRARPLTSDRTPAADVDAPRSFTRWANRNCSVCFTSLAPLRRRAARGSRAHRTRPWPRRHSLQGWSAVFLKPQFRAQHERPGFPTANDHNRTTSGPPLLMSQWPSSTGAQC
jgi:hypothetical protein